MIVCSRKVVNGIYISFPVYCERKKEVTNPTRIVTTTVRVSGGTETVVSVKTKEDIPKDQIFACIRAMKGITVPAPVHIGDVVLHDVAHTGVDVIATKNVEI